MHRTAAPRAELPTIGARAAGASSARAARGPGPADPIDDAPYGVPPRIAADDRREGGGGLLREGRRDALLGQSRLRLACRGAVGGLAVRPGPGRLELDIASVEKGVLGLEKAAFRSDDDMRCELQRAAGHDASSKHGADPLVFSKTARDRHRLPADPLGAGRAGPWRAMARRWRGGRGGGGAGA